MRCFEGLPPFYEDPVLGAHPGPDHDGGGGGESKGAGTRDGQDADGGLEGEADDHLLVRYVPVIVTSQLIFCDQSLNLHKA